MSGSAPKRSLKVVRKRADTGFVVAVRYSIDLPSPATLTLLPRGEVIDVDAPGDGIVIVDFELREL